jgi:hypothetical protein
MLLLAAAAHWLPRSPRLAHDRGAINWASNTSEGATRSSRSSTMAVLDHAGT